MIFELKAKKLLEREQERTDALKRQLENPEEFVFRMKGDVTVNQVGNYKYQNTNSNQYTPSLNFSKNEE